MRIIHSHESLETLRKLSVFGVQLTSPAINIRKLILSKHSTA